MNRMTKVFNRENPKRVALRRIGPYAMTWTVREDVGKALLKLAAYEDTGLEPGEITTKPYGCVFYCNRKCNLDGDFCAEGPGCPHELMAEDAMHLLELAQAEKDEQLVVMPPNDPLTLEELREMDGEPVWVEVSENWSKSGSKSGWYLVRFHKSDDRLRIYIYNTRSGAGGGDGMSVMDKHQEIHSCAGCEWLAVETDSGGDFVGFCLHVKSENYRSPVSLIETCEAWEAWEAREEADPDV